MVVKKLKKVTVEGKVYYTTWKNARDKYIALTVPGFELEEYEIKQGGKVVSRGAKLWYKENGKVVKWSDKKEYIEAKAKWESMFPYETTVTKEKLASKNVFKWEYVEDTKKEDTKKVEKKVANAKKTAAKAEIDYDKLAKMVAAEIMTKMFK